MYLLDYCYYPFWRIPKIQHIFFFLFISIFSTLARPDSHEKREVNRMQVALPIPMMKPFRINAVYTDRNKFVYFKFNAYTYDENIMNENVQYLLHYVTHTVYVYQLCKCCRSLSSAAVTLLMILVRIFIYTFLDFLLPTLEYLFDLAIKVFEANVRYILNVLTLTLSATKLISGTLNVARWFSVFRLAWRRYVKACARVCSCSCCRRWKVNYKLFRI